MVISQSPASVANILLSSPELNQSLKTFKSGSLHPSIPPLIPDSPHLLRLRPSYGLYDSHYIRKG